MLTAGLSFNAIETEIQEALAARRLLLNHMSDGVALWDDSFRLRFFNDRIIPLLDLPRTLMQPGTPVRDIMRFQGRRGDFGTPPESEAELDAVVDQRVAKLLDPAGTRYVRATPSGFWVEVVTVPLSEGGHFVVYRDITVLKQREVELQELRATHELVLGAMSDGLMLLTPELQIKFSNAQFQRLFDLPPELACAGVCARSIMRFQAQRGDFGPPPVTVSAMEQLIDRLLNDLLTPLSGSPRHCSTASGRWVESTHALLPDRSILITYSDITRLKQREAELERQRVTHQLVLDSLTDGVALYDAGLKLQLANSPLQRLQGFDAGYTVPGPHLPDVLRYQASRGDFGPPPATPEALDALVEDRLALVKTPGGSQYVRKSASGYWIEFSFQPVEDGGLFCHYRDITRLKQREDELARARDEAEAARDAAETADRAKSTFLAAMSHEIRTPMNGVLGMMEVLVRTSLSPEQLRCVEIMRGSADALLRIIDDVLDVSKIEAGRLELEELPFSVQALVEEAAETLSVEAERKNLRLFADPPGDGPDVVQGDCVRVRQILFNLVGNAIKFTSRGYVRILYDTYREGGGVRLTLTVEDSGIGLTVEQAARLFQPFVQADSSTTRRYGGSGLGLTIVRRLAELMGGTAQVESVPGRGSRFTVTLCLAAANTVLPRQELTSSAPLTITTSKDVVLPRLMVVDDHAVNREVIVRQLEMLGFKTDTAANGDQALALWRARRHQIVLLDLHMPILDGFGLARAIRQDEVDSAVPRTALLAVSANALTGEEERCLLAGMDAFLSKPLSIDALSRALAQWQPPIAVEASRAAEADRLFDPEALHKLFGADRERIDRLLLVFASGVEVDSTAIADAVASGNLASGIEAAHRLKGAARAAGAWMLAEAAAKIEAHCCTGDFAGIGESVADLRRLAATTLVAMRRFHSASKPIRDSEYNGLVGPNSRGSLPV
jgi:signal transduction histidine kinase/CheY-like chemotaxis protein/HPt (histidine-containing phosphotransfer) domain-containing protein